MHYQVVNRKQNVRLFFVHEKKNEIKNIKEQKYSL